MSGSKLIVRGIRDQLRAKGMTYRELAAQLGISEPTVKRDLSRGNFSLGRLDRICEILGLGIDGADPRPAPRAGPADRVEQRPGT